MKPSQVIAQSRVILNDPAGVTPRWSDADLLAHYNDYRKALARGKGELFTELETITLVAGATQQVSRSTTFGLVEVVTNDLGHAVREVDRDVMSHQTPAWRVAAAGAMKVWTRPKGDPFRFLCSPPAVGGETATVSVVKVPGDILVADIAADDGISDAYRASAASYVAGLALTVNTNAADTQKGMLLLNAAMTMAGMSAGG